ncbi:MAG: zeta toxin family protein [Bacteroidales bacterium]|jgi:predicted ABC-type ATPase|nr:zeta toxin family protein [Bacteroidales bacterium]MBQ5365313.1 zeta toxin family protein [Spirochaetales bacterium]MBO7585315.1 zeta toxin family protein [Bacteroidales bacterium]MBP5316448.1 zeta toxin family protein [Bacteroidales bacterium]MBQ4021661.1 zeta toxin family protein [Bacteroidales bacterium]
MPKIYIIGGCNGAGKTTASYTILPDMFNCHDFVNSDEIAMRLSPDNPESAAIRASRIMLERMHELIEQGADFGIETTLATRTLIKIIKEAQMSGYVVTLIFFWLNVPELALQRVKLRVASGGHNVPERTILRRYHMGITNLFDIYIPAVDYWMIVDNSNTPSAMIAEGGKDVSTKLHNKTIYNLLINYERTRNETA